MPCRVVTIQTETPIGGDIDPSLNTFIDSSSDNSDAEVMRYLGELSERDRKLLLEKLEGKESPRRHKHRHKHRHHSRKHSSVC